MSIAKNVATTDSPAVLVHYGHACVCQSRVRTLQANQCSDHLAGLCTDCWSQRKTSWRVLCIDCRRSSSQGLDVLTANVTALQ
jgi:hypothetical protein